MATRMIGCDEWRVDILAVLINNINNEDMESAPLILQFVFNE